jgi:hypothetical protein
MHHICKDGFEHHAAMTGAHCAAALCEAMENYLGWQVYQHTL